MTFLVPMNLFFLFLGKIPEEPTGLKTGESLSVEQRLAIYKRDVSMAAQEREERQVRLLEPVAFEETLEKERQQRKKERQEEISKAEALAKQRDFKRRRSSYRAKNVHLTKRTQTEVCDFPLPCRSFLTHLCLYLKIYKDIIGRYMKEHEEGLSFQEDSTATERETR